MHTSPHFSFVDSSRARNRNEEKEPNQNGPLEIFWVGFSEQTQLEELVFLCRRQLSTSLWSVSFGVLLDKLSFLRY
jgi:hypothetical protein